MNLETKITIYKFTPQVFTLTQYFSHSLYSPHIIIEQMAFTYKRSS